MKPLISIVVPVYNVENYILKCLNSLIKQNYKQIEIILVDDGSTDESGKICDEFKEKDDRIRVFHKKNGGLSSARNYGIKKAKGDIIAFVDSDDYVKDVFVLDLYRGMQAGNADIVICGYNNEKPKSETISGKEATIRLLTKQENIDIISWNKLYKKKLFTDNNIFFPEGKKHEDTLTTYKLISKAKKVTYIDESLYIYVERKGSITASEKIEERLLMREKAAKEAVEYLGNDKDLKAAAEVGLLWAKYNFLNYALKKEIDEKYEKETLVWLEQNAANYKNNKYMTAKLKTYNLMSTRFDGLLYKIFRKI
ncbi:glycosyltransferase [Candidatus Saccharibacteria bacterium]|nr:glycosyltransferase [Candidatus Saccharibacteria bacterium]